MKSKPTDERYKPVPLYLNQDLAHAMRRPGFKAAWDALEEEYATLSALLAARMGTTKSAISRLEASLRSDKGSPSFATLRKYAHACGKRLVVRMV